MTYEEAIKILEQHNKWRRDSNVPSVHEPVDIKELGIAIDVICNYDKDRQKED